MRAWGGAWIAVIIACGAGACTDETMIDGRWGQSEWDYLQTYRRTTLMPTRSDAAATLGQAVFFDTSYAGRALAPLEPWEHADMSCASCHRTQWLADTAPSSQGVVGWTPRNTIALVDLAYREAMPGARFTWDGAYDDLGEVLELPLLKPMKSTKRALAETVSARYADQYEAAYGTIPRDAGGRVDANAMYENLEEAIAAYEERLTTGDAPFDRYLGGNGSPPDLEAIDEAAKRGLALFIGDALCSDCHAGEMFADGGFHNTGVPQFGEHAKPEDRGFGWVLCHDPQQEPCDPVHEVYEGAFRTPSLRNVAMTPPYMHAGQYASLGEVVDFYWRGGGGGMYAGTQDILMNELVELTAEDRADLVAFMETLSSRPLDDSWFDAP